MKDLDELLGKFMSGSISDAERKELSLLVAVSDDETLMERLELIWDRWQGKEQLGEVRSSEILQAIVGRKQKTAPVRRLWVRWVAAAVVLFVVAALWFVVERRSQVTGDKEQVAKTNDVEAPKDTRAVITLADGSKVYLDSAGNGVLAQQNNVNVVRSADGIISYELNRQDTKTQGSTAYNTLFNPRGSKVISLTLSDGTKVWLNSESSLRYPASFAPSAVREVEITGEAYFEVAHNAAKPFHVKKGETDITVLGTHFNVNAYDDEENLKVTLLEGSVKVSSSRPRVLAVKLKPGEQAVLNQVNPKISRIEVQTNVDVDQVMSWKNGLFSFANADFATVMKQLARWYDLDVSYAGTIPNGKFKGEISKDLTLSQILNGLSVTRINYRLEGKKITILSE